MTKPNETGSITTNVGDREFTLERIFDAPRELVFKAFTDPEHVSRWWAPGGFTMPVCKMDLRPGGLWHYCFESAEGERYWSRSIYKEIIEPERLVYSDAIADEEANPVEGIPEKLVTVTFIEHDGRTKLNVNVQFSSEQDLKAAVDMGMMEGLKETIANLEAHLKQIQ